MNITATKIFKKTRTTYNLSMIIDLKAKKKILIKCLKRLNDNNFRLYIDLNEGNRGDEDGLNIQGFKTNNIFFITDRQKIRLEEVKIGPSS